MPANPETRWLGMVCRTLSLVLGLGTLSACVDLGKGEGHTCGMDVSMLDMPCRQDLECVDGVCVQSTECDDDEARNYGVDGDPCEELHSRAAGEACSFDRNCAEPLLCLSDGEHKSCAPPRQGAQGSSCEREEACAAGLRCNLRTKECIVPQSAAAGALCGRSLDCQRELVCALEGPDGDYVCLRPQQEGEPCDARPCAEGLRCVDADPRLPPACRAPLDAGFRCTGDDECVDWSCRAGRCR